MHRIIEKTRVIHKPRLWVAAFLAWIATPCFVEASPVIPAGTPIDETYRQKFSTCDATNVFDGVTLPIVKDGKTIWYGCRTDPSKFETFSSIAVTGASPAAVVIVSKLAHDEDGSWKACHHAGGPTDQCGTALMLKATSLHPCPPHKGSDPNCLPVDPDAIPYVVVPLRAPPGIDPHAFSHLSHVLVGDYGVAIAGERVVPVIVADTGPAYKMGEGSTALLKALSAAGTPTPISHGVTVLLFPGSREAWSALSADTLAAHVRDKGRELFGRLTATAPKP